MLYRILIICIVLIFTVFTIAFADQKVISANPGHGDDISALAFSPDGKILASGSRDYDIKLWDVATGENIATLEGHKGFIRLLVFSPDGKILASASYEKMTLHNTSAHPDIRLWDVFTGENIVTLEGPLLHWPDKDILSLAFSPDGEIVFAAERSARYSAYSPDGKMLASGRRGGEIKILDISTGENIATINTSFPYYDPLQHPHPKPFIFSPDGKILASVSGNRGIQLWDVATGENIAFLDVGGVHIDYLDVGDGIFSPDSKIFASTSQDDITLWNVSTGEKIATLEGHKGEITSLAFNPDGKILASGSKDYDIKLWNVVTGENTATLEGRDPLKYLAVSPDGRILAAGSYWGEIKLLDVTTGESIANLGNDINTMSFSPDSKTLAAGSGAGEIKLWDVTTGEKIAFSPAYTSRFSSIIFSENGEILAFDGDLWDVETEEKIDFPKSVYTDIESIRKDKNKLGKGMYISPDGKILAYLYHRLSGKYVRGLGIQTWNLITGKSLGTIKYGGCVYHSNPIFSPNGRFIAVYISGPCSGGGIQKIVIWNTVTGEVISSLREPTNVNTFFYSDRNLMLAYASSGKIYIQPLFKFDQPSPPNQFGLASPQNGSFGNATPRFAWQASRSVTQISDATTGEIIGPIEDPRGIASYQLWIDGKLWKEDIHSTSYTLAESEALPNGFHTWTVKAFDWGGHGVQASQTWTVRVDADPPAPFSLATPEDGIWTGNKEQTFTWQGSSDKGTGLAGYELYINGRRVRSTSELEATTQLKTDEVEWYVVAVDKVGYTTQSSETWTLYVDVIPPEKPALLQPESDIWAGPTPEFKWSEVKDAGVGFSHYEFWLDNVQLIEQTEGTSFALSDENPLQSGTHTWYIVAVDKLGNRVESERGQFKVDVTPPAEFTLQSPIDGGLVNFPTPEFSWNSTQDKHSGLSHYQLWIDDKLSVDNLSNTRAWSPVPLDEGRHTWFVKAFDNLGNVRQSETHTVIAEWSPPQNFELLSPENGVEVFSLKPILTWQESTDVGAGLEKYQLWIDGKLNQGNIPPTQTSAAPVKILPGGPHNWFVKAIDKAGNETASTSIWKFIVKEDKTPPTSEITSLKKGQLIGGENILLLGTADDGPGAIENVEISFDGGTTWQSTTNTNGIYTTWEYSHLWTGYVSGKYTIMTRATDAAGNVETPGDGINITVDLTKPKVIEVTATPNIAKAGDVEITVRFEEPNGLDESVEPFVAILPSGSKEEIPVTVQSYDAANRLWKGVVTITDDTPEGSAQVLVRNATDSVGNVMEEYHQESVFLVDVTPPTAFALVSPENGSEAESGRVTFTWEPSTDALSGHDGYELWLNGILTLGGIASDKTSVRPPASALPAGEYKWKIVSLDKVGNRTESEEWTVYVQVPATPWDVNDDGQVDISDLVLVELNFGEKIEVPVSPNPDVNGDGIVDISDLALIGIHLGESTETPPEAQ